MKTILIFITLLSLQNTFGQFKKYTPKQIKEDFDYLYKNLEASHYNLFANNPKTTYDKEYRRIFESINDSLTTIQAFRLFQPFIALDNHAHCNIMPFKLYGEYYGNSGTVFPLNLCFRNNKTLITSNFSSDTTITPGNEIISINGKPMKEIRNEMHTFFSGESDYLISTLIEMLTFPRLYWSVYDRFDKFHLELRNADGQQYKTTIDAITAEEFEKKNAALKPLMNNLREFKFIDSVAYLHPGVFMNLNAKDENESSDNKKFCLFIDSVFTEIHNSKTKDLIIDLRNNPGGHNSFSDYMIAYFADKPFRFSDNFMVKTSKLTKAFWENVADSSLFELKNDILTKKDGEIFRYNLQLNQPRTDSLHFSGKVYVLINRYDFSQAVNAAAVVQDYKFGVLIGEETGDHSSLFASSQTIKLPNTGLIVQYPKAFIVRPNGNKKAKGVIPDFIVNDDIFSEKDEILDYTLNLIKKGD